MSATTRLDPVFVLALALVNGFIVTLPWFGTLESPSLRGWKSGVKFVKIYGPVASRAGRYNGRRILHRPMSTYYHLGRFRVVGTLTGSFVGLPFSCYYAPWLPFYIVIIYQFL